MEAGASEVVLDNKVTLSVEDTCGEQRDRERVLQRILGCHANPRLPISIFPYPRKKEMLTLFKPLLV